MPTCVVSLMISSASGGRPYREFSHAFLDMITEWGKGGLPTCVVSLMISSASRNTVHFHMGFLM